MLFARSGGSAATFAFLLAYFKKRGREGEAFPAQLLHESLQSGNRAVVDLAPRHLERELAQTEALARSAAISGRLELCLAFYDRVPFKWRITVDIVRNLCQGHNLRDALSFLRSLVSPSSDEVTAIFLGSLSGGYLPGIHFAVAQKRDLWERRAMSALESFDPRSVEFVKGLARAFYSNPDDLSAPPVTSFYTHMLNVAISRDKIAIIDYIHKKTGMTPTHATVAFFYLTTPFGNPNRWTRDVYLCFRYLTETFGYSWKALKSQLTLSKVAFLNEEDILWLEEQGICFGEGGFLLQFDAIAERINQKGFGREEERWLHLLFHRGAIISQKEFFLSLKSFNLDLIRSLYLESQSSARPLQLDEFPYPLWDILALLGRDANVKYQKALEIIRYLVANGLQRSAVDAVVLTKFPNEYFRHELDALLRRPVDEISPIT